MSTLSDRIHTILHATNLDEANAAAATALEEAGLTTFTELQPFATLTPAQQAVAQALTREGLRWGGRGLPSSRRILLRWLGQTPPCPLDRTMTITRGGETVTAPAWQLWQSAPLDELESNQGLPSTLAAQWSPAEAIEAAAESIFEEYRINGSPLEGRLVACLTAAGETALGWAETFASEVAAVRSPDGPRARPELRGYRTLGIYDFDTLGILALYPFVKAGKAIDPSLDLIVPFSPHRLVREIWETLPIARREAIFVRRLKTDWGPNAEKVLNGFSTGYALLDLCPTETVTRLLMIKLRSNRSHFAKKKAVIDARFAALAAQHPGVAAGLKPVRAPRKPKA